MSKELDIILDNPALTFPESVQYDFVFVNHSVPLSRYTDNLRQADVVCWETPDTYPDAYRDRVTKALQIMAGICLSGHTDEDIRELEGLFPSEGYGDDAHEAAYDQKASDIVVLSGSGVGFRAVDTFMPDPEERSSVPPKLGGKHENLLKALSECPYRESLVLRQLSAIGHEIADESDQKMVKVVYGPAHWPLAVGAKRLGANVCKTYVEITPREIFNAWPKLQAPYYRARFSGKPVTNPIKFLATIHPAFAQIENYEDMLSMDERLESIILPAKE